MLFPTPFLLEKQTKLLRQVERGTLSPAEGFRRALEYDPCDFLALAASGRECEKAGDTAGARHYYWRALEAEPRKCESYIFLTISYSEAADDLQLGSSLMYLSLRRAAGEPKTSEGLSKEWLEFTRACDPPLDRAAQID